MTGDTEAGTGDADGRIRCEWARGDDALMRAYHDDEWGRPTHDERALFELLTLEGAQAGLSWRTILHRREGYRTAFAGFDPDLVARFTTEDQARLLLDPGIIRNRAKIASTVANAQAVLRLRDEVRDGVGGLPAHLWSFVGGEPIVGRFQSLADIPARTAEAEAMSRDLRKRGFAFVGPTICYALMQAAGLVNDHTVDCFAYRELAD